MPLWAWIADAVGAVLLLIFLYGLCLVLRRRWIARRGGTFELSLRVRSDRAGRGWVVGVGRYAGDDLELFRFFSLSRRPLHRLARSDVAYAGQRLPSEDERHALYSGHVVVRLDAPGGPVEFALDPDSLTGMLAWLEAAPPGRGPRIV